MLYLLYAILAACSDICGGLLILHPRIRTLETRYVIGFAAGIVISAAFFELIPKSNIEKNAIFLSLGFFVFYLIEKTVMLHSCGEKECEIHSIGWLSVAGMASDNVVDGVGIAIAYLTDPISGLLVAIAVIVHEVPQGITSATLMKEAGFRWVKILTVLLVAGLMYPLGAGLSGFIPESLYSIIIAFVAGVFTYIGAGDLLVEAHKRFNAKVILSVIFGVVLFLAIESVL